MWLPSIQKATAWLCGDQVCFNIPNLLAGFYGYWLRFIREKKKICCNPPPAIVTMVMRGVIVPAPVGAAKM